MSGRTRVMPRLGGWLSIGNLTLWAVLSLPVTPATSLDFGYVWNTLILAALFATSLPILWTFVFIPAVNVRIGYEHVVGFCVILTLNSFLWGYGVAGLWRMIRGPSRPRPELFPEK